MLCRSRDVDLLGILHLEWGVIGNRPCKLRKRLGAVGDRIETVPGVGYRFRS